MKILHSSKSVSVRHTADPCVPCVLVLTVILFTLTVSIGTAVNDSGTQTNDSRQTHKSTINVVYHDMSNNYSNDKNSCNSNNDQNSNSNNSKEKDDVYSNSAMHIITEDSFNNKSMINGGNAKIYSSSNRNHNINISSDKYITQKEIGNRPIIVIDNIKLNTNKHNNKENVPDINNICPGVKYFPKQTHIETVFYDNVTDCDNITLGFTSGQGIVYGRCHDSRTFCHIHIQVPQDKIVMAVIYIPVERYNCLFPRSHTLVYDSLPLFTSLESTSADYSVSCLTLSNLDRKLLSSTNHMYVVQHNKFPNYMVFKETGKTRLFLYYTSSHSGYVKCYIPSGSNLKSMDEWKYLNVPVGHVVIITVEKAVSIWTCQAYVKVYHKENQRVPTLFISVCQSQDLPVKVFNTTRVQIHLCVSERASHLTANVFVIFRYQSKGQYLPQRVSSSFMCHVNVSKAHGLERYCAITHMCTNGQDEEKYCPLNTNGCTLWMASHHKCFQVIMWTPRIFVNKARAECHKSGGNLASFKTKSQWFDFLSMLRHLQINSFMKVHVGLSCGWHSTQFMYSQFCKWSDNTMVYYMDRSYFPQRSLTRKHLTASMSLHHSLKLSHGKQTPLHMYSACEYSSQGREGYSTEPVLFPVTHHSPIREETQQGLYVCPGDHLTHNVLLCDLKSHCGQIASALYCKVWNSTKQFMQKHNSPDLSLYKVAMFACDDDQTTVPYTLVCDFRQDCPDNSDESFCGHPPCHGFQCDNDQCVLTDKRCNEYSDCPDDSDELNCYYYLYELPTIPENQQSVLINLDGTGYFTHLKMEANTSCPDTHYRCTSEWRYCLPVYTRCNGLYDCINHEDEKNCDRAICPGFYRCQNSSVCLHVYHLCDGWGQCPQRDDEWLCDMTCPVECLCQGLSFVCPQPFSAHFLLNLRYLDAKGSGLTLSEVRNHTYLVHLSLSYCSLVFLSPVSYPNMRFLDLSNNKLTKISVNVFLGQPNLQVLLLAGNPLISLTKEPSNLIQNTLKKVDLSQTCLTMFDSDIFEYFPHIESLNISFSAIQMIGPVGFQKIPQLTELDLRGNLIHTFPFDSFLELNALSTVFSFNYRICCPEILSKSLNSLVCVAPQAVLSSCEHMIQSKPCRFAFICFSVLTIFGSCVCFIFQCTLKPNILKNSFGICLTNFQCASVCMGIHTSIIAIANEVFHGNYLLHENTWTHSVTCKVAGFVSFLSAEVSILIVWFMTLDHISVLCLPSNTLRLNIRSSAVVCGVMWLFGLLLASVSLFSGLSEFGVYGQSALCHFVLFDKRYSIQDSGFLWFIVTFNLLLCLMITAGQVIIHRATPKYEITADSTKKSVFSSQFILAKVGITVLVCWFSICINSLMTIAGVAVSDQLNVVMAVCVLPLSSALCPVWYWWSRIHNTRQQEKEQHLLRTLKVKLMLSKTH